VPANFRRGARFAWRALLDAATEAERPALLDSADLLFEYVDRVSRLYAEVYEAAARAAPESAEERGARALLRRLSNDEAGLPEDIQLAERISFELERAPRPFVIAAPLRQARHHAELAAQLRRRGALAASEGRRVVGLANTRSPWSGIELDPSAIVAQAPAAIRSECGQALDELRGAVDVASARGRRGEIAAEDYLAELLLRRSPRVASRISSRIYAPLSEELARTLDVLVLNSFERGASAAELPVHRNTLRDRIKRISELTGIDLDSARGRGLAWLACLERRDSVSPESAGVES
jgi:DNA-binding PucR family transcriptional regulator